MQGLRILHQMMENQMGKNMEHSIDATEYLVRAICSKILSAAFCQKSTDKAVSK